MSKPITNQHDAVKNIFIDINNYFFVRIARINHHAEK